MGIKCWEASSLVSELASWQTACAMLPLTCWDDSVASWSFKDGRILETMRFDEQFFASSGNLAAASDRTSASESPSKVM